MTTPANLCEASRHANPWVLVTPQLQHHHDIAQQVALGGAPKQLLTRYEQTRPPPPVTSPPVHFVDEEAFSNSGQQSELANSGFGF